MKEFSSYRKEIDAFLHQCLVELGSGHSSEAIHHLVESMRYSLLGEGKRFRPLLSLLTAEALGVDHSRVLPFGAAVEFIHCYSLIHDDLPAMDNSDWRRGHLTNHKVFGEAKALLAGDALLTEAFGIISKYYRNDPSQAIELVQLLVESAGVRGMVGGQAMDLFEKPSDPTYDDLLLLHGKKTGALITASVLGAAVIGAVSSSTRDRLLCYAQNLGIAFQVADDLLDLPEEVESVPNFARIMGVGESLAFLERTTQKALDAIGFLGESGTKLQKICRYNCDRASQSRASCS